MQGPCQATPNGLSQNGCGPTTTAAAAAATTTTPSTTASVAPTTFATTIAAAVAASRATSHSVPGQLGDALLAARLELQRRTGRVRQLVRRYGRLPTQRDVGRGAREMQPVRRAAVHACRASCERAQWLRPRRRARMGVGGMRPRQRLRAARGGGRL